MRREKTKHPGIYKIGDKYYINYRVGGRKYEKMIGDKLRDAQREKVDRETKGRRGRHDAIEKQERMTFADLIRIYESESDTKQYILKFKDAYLTHFGTYRLSQIAQRDLFKFKASLKATPKQRGGKTITDSTVNRALAGLRRLFHFAVTRQLMEESPFPSTPKSGLFYPEPKGRRNYFTEAQIILIYESAPGWMKPLLAVAYYTGMRMGELQALRWDHLDLDNGIIRIPESKTLKDLTGLGQTIVMQVELCDLLRSLPHRSEWVFVKPDGLPYQHWDIDKPFKKLLRSLKLNGFSWRDIRHTTGTLMHLKGADLLAIKDQLRHTSSQTTERFYIGSDIEYQRTQIGVLTLKKEEAKA